ncbi:MAG TPA: hypothetical protein VGV59_09350 [Pyrinomonadaceae bacterium]|nr:hypothetical protein [Pyrinomonadaceae bacterium]
MTDPKEKPKPTLREPKPKKSLGLSIEKRLPYLREPHEDLIKPEATSLTSLTSQTSQTPSVQEQQPVAPARDFTRVANSINRDAVPAGLFKGKSKQLYDCLYLMTRGAVVPTRSVRISRPQLMKKAHIGSRVTFEANMAHLQAVGLISIRQIIGEHEGNEYSVLLPEEISMPSLTSLTSLTGYAQKLDRLVRLETSQTRHTSIVDSKDTYDVSQTSFKTKEKNDDDEAAPRALREAERELTGKESPAAQWASLFEILATELRIAAARTTVSSAPAFLAEHLRRRLWKHETGQGPGAENSLQVKSEPGIDVSKCPDCGGTGWWYPNGFEAGVAKCKHEKSGAGR